MGKKEQGPVRGGKELRAEIERWRVSRKSRREAMPEVLWSRAVELGRVHGAYRVSRDVKVSYEKLKMLVEKAEEEASSGAEFVAVDMSPVFSVASPPSMSQVEVVRADGSMMRMEVAPLGIEDVMRLSASFLGRAS